MTTLAAQTRPTPSPARAISRAALGDG
jgi:hypothetical protein